MGGGSDLYIQNKIAEYQKMRNSIIILDRNKKDLETGIIDLRAQKLINALKARIYSTQRRNLKTSTEIKNFFATLFKFFSFFDERAIVSMSFFVITTT